MAHDENKFGQQARAREKQRSRDNDDRALATGEKTREQLRRENGYFAFPNVRIHIDPKSLV